MAELGCSVAILGWVGPPILAAVGLMVVVAALFYMLGNMFRKEEYIELSKTELYNIFVTLALAFSFLGIIGLANELSCSGDQGARIFDKAIDGMNRVIYGDSYPVLRNLFQMMLEISALANFTVGVIGVKFVPLGSFKYLYSSLNVVSFIMESVFSSLYIQSMLLAVLKETALTIFLPVGIFLRTFPILREAGTFIMVMAFSLYTVYPYIYVVSLDAYDAVQQSMTFDQISSEMSLYDPNYAVQYAQWADKTVFWALTFFSYDGLQDMFMKLGGHIFVGIVVPALAIMLSTAMAQSIMRFIKEVTA